MWGTEDGITPRWTGTPINWAGVLLTMAFLIQVPVGAQTVVDFPEFSTSNQSLWDSGAGVRELSFKEDLLDLADVGRIGGILDANIDNTIATEEGELQLLCPAGSFFDVATGGCFACPAGYVHNPLLPASDPAVCTTITNQTIATRVGDAQFICPAGQFPDLASGGCYSCPADYLHDAALPASVPGVCYQLLTDTMAFQRSVGCDAGEFDGGNGRCYTCPPGYTRDAVGLGCHLIEKTTMDL